MMLGVWQSAKQMGTLTSWWGQLTIQKKTHLNLQDIPSQTAAKDVLALVLQKKEKKEGRKTHVLHGQETIKGTKDPWKDDSKDPLSGKSIVSIRIWTRKQDGF